jgi:hypothetical protein
MIIWQFLTENCIHGGILFLGEFFLSKNQLFISEMDSRAKTKYKKNKVKKKITVKIKSFFFLGGAGGLPLWQALNKYIMI